MAPRLSKSAVETNQSNGTNHRPVKRQKTSNAGPPRDSSSEAATVLFRHSDASTKKHTRPPISKLFSSVGLSPEQFLELSANAKNYMLDERHPERRDTVGVRGKSDSELVKLKLWNCVQDFVEREGNGEKFFRANVPGSRSMIWPEDKAKIIKALFPLLRRVITNEKQRQYALESRSKINSQETKTPDEATRPVLSMSERISSCKWDPTEYKVGVLFHEFTRLDLSTYEYWKEYRQSPKLVQLFKDTGISEPGFDELIAIVDHHLRLHHATPEAELAMCSKPCENSVVEGIVDSYPEIWEYGHWRSEFEMNPCDKSINVRVLLHELFQTLRVLTGHSVESEASFPPSEQNTPASEHSSVTTLDPQRCNEPCKSPLTLRITIMAQEQDTILYKREMLAADTPYIHTLMQNICQTQARHLSSQAKVYVHLPEGLTLIENDGSWANALKTARHTIWLDGQVNVLIRVPT